MAAVDSEAFRRMLDVATNKVFEVNGVLHCLSCDPSPTTVVPKTCDHILLKIKHSLDAEYIKIGDMVQVPIFPAAHVWAQVTIEGVGTVNSVGKQKLIYFDELNIDRSVYIGLWTAGDGRLAMRGAVLELLRSRLHPGEDFTNPDIMTRCPSKTHGFEASERMRKNTDLAFKQHTVWCIAMEKACAVCVEATLPDTPDKKDGETNRVNPQGKDDPHPGGVQLFPSDRLKQGDSMDRRLQQRLLEEAIKQNARRYG